jgi:hypothetical protein
MDFFDFFETFVALRKKWLPSKRVVWIACIGLIVWVFDMAVVIQEPTTFDKLSGPFLLFVAIFAWRKMGEEKK